MEGTVPSNVLLFSESSRARGEAPQRIPQVKEVTTRQNPRYYFLHKERRVHSTHLTACTNQCPS